MENIAVVIWGDGKELGNLQTYANTLKSELSGKYKKIIFQYVNRDHLFLNLLLSIDPSKELIGEFHIFCHSIGAGIFLGYGDESIAKQRNDVVNRAYQQKRKPTYHEVLQTEVGAIQTDDLKLNAFSSRQADLQKRFANDAFIKLWGCNSGRKNWTYSDGDVTDPNDNSVAYYWRAFNEFNVPKPSIAQAFATFFNRKVYGANSGASSEVKFKNSWISSQKYKNQVGRWPSATLPHRLVPDKGAYSEYKP